MPPITLNSATGKWIMASVILASAMAFIDGTALNVVLPSLQKDLNATGTDLFWLLNSYLLMLAALILPGGSLGDKLGRKKIFMIGITIFMLASAACGFAPTVFYIIIFRTVQGIGGALMIPGSLSKQVVAQAVNLGDAKVPSIINGENKIKIEQDYKEGFINTYVMVMRICAGLAALSALMAFIFIKNEELKKE